ncbi:MAG: transposase [Chloroflexi bacterium]|nr:transposase [Chloroflexota bacterium]
MSKSMTVVVMTDRGLGSPRLWQQIRALGWHPLMRVKNNTSFQPLQGQRQQARRLIPGPGHAWVGGALHFIIPSATASALCWWFGIPARRNPG